MTKVIRCRQIFQRREEVRQEQPPPRETENQQPPPPVSPERTMGVVLDTFA